MSNVVVSRNIPNNLRNIKFDDNSFELYLLIEGEEKLSDLYKKANLSKTDFFKALNKLFSQGLIFKVSEDEYLSLEKIEMIKFTLATYVGPLAKIVLADAFTALGFPANKFPKSKFILLVKKIAEQIPFDKALKFKESMEVPINDD
jgi:hypothetical protein